MGNYSGRFSLVPPPGLAMRPGNAAPQLADAQPECKECADAQPGRKEVAGGGEERLSGVSYFPPI